MRKRRRSPGTPCSRCIGKEEERRYAGRSATLPRSWGSQNRRPCGEWSSSRRPGGREQREYLPPGVSREDVQANYHCVDESLSINHTISSNVSRGIETPSLNYKLPLMQQRLPVEPKYPWRISRTCERECRSTDALVAGQVLPRSRLRGSSPAAPGRVSGGGKGYGAPRCLLLQFHGVGQIRHRLNENIRAKYPGVAGEKGCGRSNEPGSRRRWVAQLMTVLPAASPRGLCDFLQLRRALTADDPKAASGTVSVLGRMGSTRFVSCILLPSNGPTR